MLAGEVQGRESDAQVTVFDSVGFALEDFSALRYLNDLVRTEGIGTQIDLIAQPSNCKDLYSLVASSGTTESDERARGLFQAA